MSKLKENVYDSINYEVEKFSDRLIHEDTINPKDLLFLMDLKELMRKHSDES